MQACRRDQAASGYSRDVFLIMMLYRAAHQADVQRQSLIDNGAPAGARFANRLARSALSRLQKWLVVLPFKIEFPAAAHIGPGLALPHPHNIVLNSRVRIGADCTLFHATTIGEALSNNGRECPTLGDRVQVGTGAIVVGPIVIGADSVVGAGAVVTKSVPAASVVVGHNRVLSGRAT